MPSSQKQSLAPPLSGEDCPTSADRKPRFAARRLHTLDAARDGTLFILWKDGARGPRSFHASEAEAMAEAERHAGYGERLCLFEARLAAIVEASRVVAVCHSPPRAPPPHGPDSGL